MGSHVVALHPLGGAGHRTIPFLIHAGGVYTVCVLLFLDECRDVVAVRLVWL